MPQESFTRLPPEIVYYAEREHPKTAIGEFFARALRRIGKSNAAEQRRLIAIGKPFIKNLPDWPRCPYAVESGVWERFTEIVQKRKEDPGPLLVGAVMTELGMSSDATTSSSSEQRPTND